MRYQMKIKKLMKKTKKIKLTKKLYPIIQNLRLKIKLNIFRIKIIV